MMAASAAAQRGLDVTLIDKNDRLGRKLLITGNGRCNVTNDTDVEGVVANTVRGGHFLYSALYAFPPSQLMRFFQDLGVPLKVERGRRVFPASDRAEDIVAALQEHLAGLGVAIQQGRVIGITPERADRYEVLCQGGQRLHAEQVVIATGGMSYPWTGSSGEGYKLARLLGHEVSTPRPSLVPLEVREEWARELAGLTLKNVAIKVIENGDGQQSAQTVYEAFGEMLFTHYGGSGPIILSASCHLTDPRSRHYSLEIDLKPALSHEQLDARVQRDLEKHSRKFFANSLDDLLPRRLIPTVVAISGIDPKRRANQVTRAQRWRLVSLLKQMPLSITSFRPFAEAIVTAGGVNTDQVDPRTMESRLCPGVFFAGEVLNVDAYTGGFNLQIAFSTGYLAGISCRTG